MNSHLQNILDLIQQDNKLAEDQKNEVLKSLSNANIELEQKRYAVETQNLELEIEAALERIRTVAMSMRKPDDLPGICEVLFSELQALGFTELRNAMINIHDDLNSSFVNYDYSDEIGKSINHLVYNIHPVIEKQIMQIRSAGDAFSETYFAGTDLEDWKTFRRKIGEKDDPRIESSSALYYYFYSIGTGAIGISTFNTISDEKKNLFRRFRNVFELAYRRFIDIQKAEAQAREAQIELGLERVRARAMAMQKSEELAELVDTVFKELTKLHFLLDRCIIMIYDPKTNGSTWWMANPEHGSVPVGLFVKYHEYKPYLDNIKAWKDRSLKWEYLLEGSSKKEWDKYIFKETDLSLLPEFVIAGMKSLDRVFLNASFNNFGCLSASTIESLPQEQFDILLRFAKVFELTYTRFNDLKQTEAQAREAQIQLALERVRARTLAMQRSDEMAETAAILFEQFCALGEMPERMAIEIVNEAEHVFEIWATEHGGKQLNMLIKASLDEPYVMQKMYRAWEAQKKSITIDLQGNELEGYFQYLKKMKLPVDRKIFGKRRVQNVATFSKGILTIITPEPRPQETIEILERFASVFDGTYTRFLDLQKAEAQAREAQIQLALERVRARTMAMQHSNELGEVSFILNKQIVELGIPTRGCAFNIYGENESTEWFSNLDGTLPTYKTPRENIFLKYYQAGQRGETILIEEFGRERIRQHYKYLISLQMLGNIEEEEILKVMPERQIDHVAYFNYGYLLFITLVPASEAYEVFKRFAKEFEQTYTRFLDLKKAEAQAREAQIEASLERVRSKTIAMHNSQDVGDTVATLFDEFVKLGIETNRCGILIFSNTIFAEVWTAKSNPHGKATLIIGQLDLTVHPLLLGIHKSWKNKDSVYTYPMLGEDLILYYQAINDTKYYPTLFEMDKLPLKEFHSDFYFSEGSIFAFTDDPVSNDAGEIIKRFASVFGQTYTRFLDLQKAEAQTREAQIETALEKVRSKSLAMHRSDELEQVAACLFEVVVGLGITMDGALLFVFNKESRSISLWIASVQLLNPISIHLPFEEEMKENEIIQEFWKALEQGSQVLNRVYTGVAKDDYFRYVQRYNGSKIPDQIKQLEIDLPSWCFTFAAEKNTMLGLDSWSGHMFTESELNTLRRFARVFEQAYTRFLDLQKAETQAKEAIKASSSDRVRAEIASMRTVDDLQRITPLIWSELNTLGVPFIRCGVFIMNEANEHVQVHLSAPDGHSLAALDLPFQFNSLTIDTVNHWHQGIIFETHWSRLEFMSFMQSMIQQGQVQNMETYQGSSQPPESLHLHFVPFKQGMLYVGNISPLELQELQLLKTLAESFSIAYARYDDFRQLEEAKNQIEKTFTELKSTQAQLIQSEKMASLGQLIAGIAHEINTPLGAINASINTITDSSQQSINLLPALVKVLSDDELKLFMELVNRSSINNNSLSSKEEREVRRKIATQLEESGITEADDFADILVDMGIYDEIENYLTLYKPQIMQAAYHLSMQIKNSQNIKMAVDRASKVVFALKNYARYGNENSMVEANIVDGLETVLTLYQNQLKHGITLHKEFEEIPSILCYPDELNQVWTNLIHNAIQAMDGKGELSISVSRNPKGFENLSGLEVRITDTGKGIPPEIKDRIFDAFFTTKAAGEGSGLGLHIVKQIINKHKGTIIFESESGKGTSFIVELPLL